MYCGDQDQVERVLRRATKLDRSLCDLPYEERLELLDIPSMFYRRQRGDMIMVFQIVTGRIKILHEQLFELAENHGTRGHHLKLKKPQVSRLFRQHFFTIRVINNWNNLPDHVVSAPSVNTFKNRLDDHWRIRKYWTRHHQE